MADDFWGFENTDGKLPADCSNYARNMAERREALDFRFLGVKWERSQRYEGVINREIVYASQGRRTFAGFPHGATTRTGENFTVRVLAGAAVPSCSTYG